MKANTLILFISISLFSLSGFASFIKDKQSPKPFRLMDGTKKKPTSFEQRWGHKSKPVNRVIGEPVKVPGGPNKIYKRNK